MKIELRKDFSNLYDMIQKVSHSPEEAEYDVKILSLDESFTITRKDMTEAALKALYSAYCAGEKKGYDDGWSDS